MSYTSDSEYTSAEESYTYSEVGSMHSIYSYSGFYL